MLPRGRSCFSGSAVLGEKSHSGGIRRTAHPCPVHRRPPGRDSVYHTGRSQGWRASPIRSSGWGADPSAQQLPSPTQPQLERLPEVNTQPHAKESASRSSQRLQVRLWMHVSTSRPRRYLAVWRGSPTGCTLPSFHMARNQLLDQGLHVFLQASEIINDISYRVEVDKCTIVGSNMDLYAALLTKSGVIPARGGRDRKFSWEHRMQEHQTIFKFSQGEHFWNPAVGRRGGTLIIAKGPWQSLGTSNQILIPGHAHMIVIKRRLPTGIDDWILAGDFNFVDHEEDKWGGIIQDRCTRVERLAWNSFLLQIGTCDTYEIPAFVTHEPRFTWRERQHRGIQRRLDRFYLTMDLCMQGGKLDIDNTYTDFSDHHPIRLTLPFRRSRGPRKPIAIPKKFFEEQANNNRAHEQWEKHKGNIHSFTLQIAQEAQAKIRKDRRGVFNTVQKVRRILTSINTDLCSNPDDQWLQAQKIQVKHQLERIEADKMEAFLKAGHIRWHASELVLNKEFYRSIRSKVVSPPMFGLKDEQGQLHTEIDDMHNMAEHYHSQLFKEEPWDEVRQEKLERVLEHIPTKYTLAMNTRLMRLFTL
ncbi:hypothetical protein SELMODRAFT_432311 [Selaginella moellendorffii]|uniref:Endonuclease/exonuclease/phosphatase domain-containing protein n=1 Tax=Selaginella moellendorffii TaxID=88036 RepID=D8TFL8_SELML|nr:hypothetical protein SELMODRAFT_432311 [Selaginella moellendorffii]